MGKTFRVSFSAHIPLDRVSSMTTSIAAYGLVSDPEDQVGSPLHGLDGVRESEEIGSDAFGVHAVLSGGTPLPLPGVFWV